MKKEKYLAQIAQRQKEITCLEKKLRQLEGLRVGSFLGVVGSLIIGFAWGEVIYYLAAVVFVGIFSALIYYYNKINHQKQYVQAQKIVLEDNIKRLDKSWLQFEEDGSQYINEDIPRIKDLDLLGKGSLFQYLCVAHTPYGKKALADALVHGTAQEAIQKRQEAIQELAHKEEFTLHLKALSQLIAMQKAKVDEESIRDFIGILENKDQIQSKWMKVLSLALPFATFFAIIAILLGGGNKVLAAIGSVSIVAGLGLSFLNFGKNSELFNGILRFCRNIDVYKNFLVAIEEQEFESDYLKALKQSICEAGGPKEGLETLYKLSEALKIRLNVIAYIVISGLLMWDFHCKDVFYNWQSKYGQSVEKWLSVMGDMETLLSLEVLCEVKESYSYPEVTEAARPNFSFKNLKHPLIQEAVGNDLSMEEATCIITGSNMSGKTTFLRTIGINLALAYAGGPVLGEDFYAVRMEVQTSMRMQDDVNEGISSFYAELLRIKGMINEVSKKRPMLALIDEIFKGTNSADRILGAKETIKALEKPWVTIMVSTHDFELCEMAKEKEGKRKFYNYHFEEYYKDNHIKFEYKIKEGRCKTTNAQFLLKMVGIYT